MFQCCVWVASNERQRNSIFSNVYAKKNNEQKITKVIEIDTIDNFTPI